MRIGIIGFGFSGLITAVNLLHATKTPLTLYIIDDNPDGLGVAYATKNPEHLLNVRARFMSAFAQHPDHLLQWLSSNAAKQAQQTLGLHQQYHADDFIPRMLYGAYLGHIWREAQEIAAQKNCSIKLVPSQAVAVHGGEVMRILTARGDAIAVDRIVLAAGHATKRMLTHIASPRMVQNPWANGALDSAATWKDPVLLIGSGLTAVDMLLSLRHQGFTGKILMTSRQARLPQPHAAARSIFSFAADEIAAAKSLQHMAIMLHKNIQLHGQWREVFDALRPHTQTLWQRLTTAEQQKFLSRLGTFWSIHRHRMAPEIAARIEAEMAAKTLQLYRGKDMRVTDENQQLSVQFAQQPAPQILSRIINCTGLELNLARSENPLLRQLMAEGNVEAHATAQGIAADPSLRAWGRLYPNLYAIGSLLTGQLLESTAVPELRQQAATIAQHITTNGDAPAAI